MTTNAVDPSDDLSASPRSRGENVRLALGALGVVYGDIGTSPLYAIRECFMEVGDRAVTTEHVLGVLSLVIWSLVMVVVVKYLTFVMRADNRGEGGVLALLALMVDLPGASASGTRKKVLVTLGLLAAGLLFADGTITPAISILSAVEGLESAAPMFEPVVLPVTMVILVGLFSVQRYGTAAIGRYFGPVMLVWFASLSVMGLAWVVRRPDVLAACNPVYLVYLVRESPWEAFYLLGAVVLVVTGAEALYADMGHFGRGPIRLAWYMVVFPALLLNYFGQGALMLTKGSLRGENLFFDMAPSVLRYPLVAIATMATIIASQALISGAYSLTQQAIQLGYLPRMRIVHTSSEMAGQIYVPWINWVLMVSCVCLVWGFQSSSALAAAYGIAVVGTMVITSVLLFAVMWERWGWGFGVAMVLTVVFLAVDTPFFLSNMTKFSTGGWLPLVMAAVVFMVMSTWSRGRSVLARTVDVAKIPLDMFIREEIEKNKAIRVDGTAVFMTGKSDIVPHVLMHHFKHNRVLHKQVILLSIEHRPVPRVPVRERVEVRDRGSGFWSVRASYGFTETPHVPSALRLCTAQGLAIDPDQVSYYLGHVTLVGSKRRTMWAWRKMIYSFLHHNESPATAFFGLPPNRVVELGRQVEI